MEPCFQAEEKQSQHDNHTEEVEPEIAADELLEKLLCNHAAKIVQIAGITKQNGNKNASGAHFFAKKQMGRQTRRSYAIPFVGRADSTGLLAVTLVGYGQLLTSLGAARSQHPTSVLRSHALAEAMLVHAAAVVRLKRSFHCLIIILL